MLDPLYIKSYLKHLSFSLVWFYLYEMADRCVLIEKVFVTVAQSTKATHCFSLILTIVG